MRFSTDVEGRLQAVVHVDIDSHRPGCWIELARIDLLFGEASMTMTSGLLLIEYQNGTYEKTYWGQPKWPLFLTEFPQEDQLSELDDLRVHMEEKIMGSFSVSQDSVWQVASDF